MPGPDVWEPKGCRKVVFNPKDWNSTYSDLGKWISVPLPSGGAAATGVYVPLGLAELHGGREPEKRLKVGLTKKALAMNKGGQQRRAEMELASPPPRKHDIRGELATPPRDPRGKALTHKLWAKEFLQSTNRADLTSIAQHSMCGVTSELLKPGVDPRKVIRLVEQLRGIALSRAQEGHKQEAIVALKQARGMIESCLQTIQRGSDLRRVVGVKEAGVALLTPSSMHASPDPEKGKGMRSAEHAAKELQIRVACDLVELSAKPADTAQPVSAPQASGRGSARGASLTFPQHTNRSGAMSAPPAPSLTIIHEESDPPSPVKQSLPWGAGPATGSLSMQKVAMSKKKPVEMDFLCGQPASSPYTGFPDSNRYMTETQKAYLVASNEALRKENKVLRVTRRGNAWVPLPSRRPPISDNPDDVDHFTTKKYIQRAMEDVHSNITVKLPEQRLAIEEALGNKKTQPLRQEPICLLEGASAPGGGRYKTKTDGW